MFGYECLKFQMVINMIKSLKFFSIFFILFAFGLGVAQENQHQPSEQRGDPTLRRKSNIDGNNVRTTIFNYGFSGRTEDRPDEIPYEWPKNTNREYIALVAIWLAGEVKNESGQTIQIVDFPTFRESPAGGSWNLEPVSGFLNPASGEIARSDDPDTWPTAAQGGWRDKRADPNDPGWVGSWNGFFGKNIFNADQEMYYRASDDLYDRFNYIPDDSDPSRGGLGFLIDVRVLEWSQVLVSDIVFFIHDVLNDGTKRVPKTSFLIWLADLVGGDGDSNDDQPFVDLQTSIAFMTDQDQIGNSAFGSTKVGVASIKYLETPGNAVDGIDNDGDADPVINPDVSELISLMQGDPTVRIPFFTDMDFQPRVLNPGDKIVLIDSLNFRRRVIEYPQGGGTVKTLQREIQLPAGGITLEEDTVADLIDNDLDGLIDERETIHLERFDEVTGTIRPVRYINYLSFNVGDTVKRGFIVPGTGAELDYANVAPMIDESRDDFFDNDKDWDLVQDDLGLDGAENTGDQGEGDNEPTSGAGTDFPGEPNIDKTDVSETDLIGITSASYDPAGGINFNTISDRGIWQQFMAPGIFRLPAQQVTGDYDLFVSSGLFPIDPGQRQRFSVAVAIAGEGLNNPEAIQSAIDKQAQARKAYETDYQFAQAPLLPTVTAVPGDGKVTLYWDDVAESSEDRYLKRIGQPFRDFEGYRIYRSTDAAFQDAKIITNAQGEKILYQPIAQFDLIDGKTGYHPVDIQGVKFDLGDDIGITHTYTDSGLINGQRYFYAVTAYDFGNEFLNIAPAETPIQIDVDPEGNVETGSNVVVIRPRAPVAGYIPADTTNFRHVSGSSSGNIGFKIIDPREVKDGHTYEITFQDTVLENGNLVTKNFTLTDSTAGEVKVEKSTKLSKGDELPVIDGFRLFLDNEDSVRINNELSVWNNDEVFTFDFEPVFFPPIIGEKRPNDYRVVVGEENIATSKDTSIGTFIPLPLPAKVVNFKVINISNSANPEPVEFAFLENHGDDGHFSVDTSDADNADVIYLLEPDETGMLEYTWQLFLNLTTGSRNPQEGDTLDLILRKPFLSRDVYQFTMRGESESKQLARRQMDDIRVVPNPYIAAETWEPRNPFTSGRGPRELHFINLPKKCTIRIFNVNGVLIDKIEHNSTLDNGTEIWDMLSKDNLEIAYGVYVYHIEAPGIGEKKGTFAIIK